jgi:uncharacterized protein involved in exopolysaccharide biosynthesis
LQYLATENQLLKAELIGHKNTLITIQKRQTKAKSLLLNLPSDSDGGALFISKRESFNSKRIKPLRKNKHAKIIKAFNRSYQSKLKRLKELKRLKSGNKSKNSAHKRL